MSFTEKIRFDIKKICIIIQIVKRWKQWPREAMESPFHLSRGRKSQALDDEVYEDSTRLPYAHKFVSMNNLQIVESQDQRKITGSWKNCLLHRRITCSCMLSSISLCEVFLKTSSNGDPATSLAKLFLCSYS